MGDGGERFTIKAAGHKLEAAWFGDSNVASRARPIVLLHEGLGSISTWRDFPERVARETNRAVFVYSRWGYGQSDPVTLPRPIAYMHDEGLVTLDQVLDAAKIEEAILVGHSDGASIAIVYAGGVDARRPVPRARGLLLLAPHVFCEKISVESISRAKHEFESGDLRARLAKHHADVDGAFRGWNDAWLDPAFMHWNIEDYLPLIWTPIVVVQGDRDPYGTLSQVDAIERGVLGPFEKRVLRGVGHAPHREAANETLTAIRDLTSRAV